MIHIVDASVVVKWLVPEHGSDTATEVLRQPVAAPDLMIVECLNALRKKVLRGELRDKRARAAADLLAAAVITLEPVQALADEILALSLRLSHPVYDCAYLALAQRLDGVVITADRKLIERCRRPDIPDLAGRVQSLYELRPMVQERPARPYIARRRAA